MDNNEVMATTDTIIRHPIIKDLLHDIKSRHHTRVARIVFVDSQGREIKDHSAYFLV